ncbi:MAG: sugar kinase, partial [Pseudomonadota bacterium]
MPRPTRFGGLIAMRLLAVGECMAELSPSETAGHYRLGFAGDTFNTAWYAARLLPAGSVAYFTRLGDDPASADLRRFAEAGQIDTRHISTEVGGTLGLYMITLKDGERSFTYWRGQSAARHLADDPAALAAAMAEAEIVYVSGITMAILAPAARDALLGELETARAAGRTIAFDPNLRPRLWSNPDDMRAEVMRTAALCHLALPSFEDEAEWFGDADPVATAARYRAAGAEAVIVKNG